jgi:hypothetical protein
MTTPANPGDQDPRWPAPMPPVVPGDDLTPQAPAAYQAYPPPGPYGPPMYGPLVRPTAGLATASLIFGIVGVFLFCLVIPSLVAVLCGHSAIKATRTGQLGGHGQAVAGLILGYAVMIPAIIWLAFGGIGMIAQAVGK